jgi:hypothetical protein
MKIFNEEALALLQDLAKHYPELFDKKVTIAESDRAVELWYDIEDMIQNSPTVKRKFNLYGHELKRPKKNGPLKTRRLLKM